MTLSKSIRLAIFGAMALAVAGCQTNNQPQIVLSKKSPVELRAMQARAFETSDQNKALRTVIATLQDLGYGVDKVEPAAGTVSASKLAKLRMTATVYPRGPSRMIIRSNAVVMNLGVESQVDDPAFYKDLFFEPLGKAMFLTALELGSEEDVPPVADTASKTTAKP